MSTGGVQDSQWVSRNEAMNQILLLADTWSWKRGCHKMEKKLWLPYDEQSPGLMDHSWNIVQLGSLHNTEWSMLWALPCWWGLLLGDTSECLQVCPCTGCKMQCCHWCLEVFLLEASLIGMFSEFREFWDSWQLEGSQIADPCCYAKFHVAGHH